MLSRRPPTISISLPASSTTPLFPGLVSSLRPIKRLILQLSDESNLVHRFSYKNKNQHKAAKWWNKLERVDRIMHRTLNELNDLLNGFGGTTKESDEMIHTITREQLVEGLLRLPRSLLLVEKVGSQSISSPLSSPFLCSLPNETPLVLSNRLDKSSSTAPG